MKPGTDAEAAGALASRMGQALEHESRFKTVLYHSAGVALGRVGLSYPRWQDEVVWNQDRTRCLLMEGELYDSAALEREVFVGDGRLGKRTHAEVVLALFERFGEACLERLNGAFSVAIWDYQTRQLTLFNDRFGLFPLYYAPVNGGVLFASGVRALLPDPALDRTVDPVAINEFLIFDHALDDRTLLENVRLLPQASVLTCREGRLDIRKYWLLRYPDEYDPHSEEEYIEGFMQHMRRAASRQRPDGPPAGLLLSGGLDSRLLAGLLSEVGTGLQTLTFGIPGCDDASVASEVAKALRTRHHFVELPPDWLQALAGEAVRITDGLGNIVNLHALASVEAQRCPARVLYKGFLGDALLGWALTRQMWAGYAGHTRYQVHLGTHDMHGVLNYNDQNQARLLTDAFRRRVGDAVMQAYRAGMDRSGSRQLANQRLYFDLTQRVPRMTLRGVEVVRHRAMVRLPFCDNDLLDFVVKVPPGFLFQRHLPKEALIRHFPRLAQIPVAGSGRPLCSCARDVLWQARSVLEWRLRKSTLGRLVVRKPRPYKDYDSWFRTRLRPWMEDILLQRRSLERGYFNPDYVRQLVAEHTAGARHAVRLGALLTLELWHRQFLD